MGLVNGFNLRKVNDKISEGFFPSLLLLFLFPNILYSIVGVDFTSSITTRIAFVFLCTLLALTPFLFLSLRQYYTLCLFYILLATLEVFHLYLFKTPLSSGLLGSIIHTNAYEAEEFLSTYEKYQVGGRLVLYC